MTLKAYFHVQTHPSLISILSQMNPIHIITPFICLRCISVLSMYRGVSSLQLLTEFCTYCWCSYARTCRTHLILHDLFFLTFTQQYFLLFLSHRSKYVLKRGNTEHWDSMEGNIKMGLQHTGCVIVDWTKLTQVKDSTAEHVLSVLPKSLSWSSFSN
jgi:hypothetical protein